MCGIRKGFTPFDWVVLMLKLQTVNLKDVGSNPTPIAKIGCVV